MVVRGYKETRKRALLYDQDSLRPMSRRLALTDAVVRIRQQPGPFCLGHSYFYIYSTNDTIYPSDRTNHRIGYSCKEPSSIVSSHQRILSRLTGTLDEIVIERVSNLCPKKKERVRREERQLSENDRTFLQVVEERDVQEIILRLCRISPIRRPSLPLTTILSATRFGVAIAGRL